MSVLSSSLRRQLESAVLAARRGSEGVSRAAIEGLGVFGDRRPEHLDAGRAALRLGLRERWRQLGGDRGLLVAECAYEQWHRLLFARFLAENELLLHPQFRAPVTLADCAELADEVGEPDGWSVAARFASQILPGIFRLDDPCVRLQLAPEGRHALEHILDGIPAEVFVADDALGWVYQFWQKDKKDEVNASKRKIGGADLGPVTQLFTENYMVRFLLENSLGAWWAARHSDSPLVRGFEYLRFDDDGRPAAGAFDGWPERVAEVTVMDPCCGSGHFLVEAFSMLWQMRAEEEDLTPLEAQDAVLRDNLFGLELDPRCVQIAMMAVALQAWKAGGGWRQLPVPNIACSGIPVKAPVDEWTALAGGDQRLEAALERLHRLFRDADTLGSLIDPRREAETIDPTGLRQSFEDVNWEDVAPVLENVTGRESVDSSAAVLGADAASIARAARSLSRDYCLVATNVPYLTAKSQTPVLRRLLERRHSDASGDLATACLDRCLDFVRHSGCVATVSPEGWLFLGSYERFRRRILTRGHLRIGVQLGPGAFDAIGGEVVRPVLSILGGITKQSSRAAIMELANARGPAEKAAALRFARMSWFTHGQLLANPSAVISAQLLGGADLLERYAPCYQGLSTSENTRFVRFFWELAAGAKAWQPLMHPPNETVPFGGRSTYVLWEGGEGELHRRPGAALRGRQAWRRQGVLVGRMGGLHATLYCGELFDDGTGVFVPCTSDLMPAVWVFVSSDEFLTEVRKLDTSIKVTNATLAKVPIDIERWSRVAEERFPDGLPEPWSDDPTQWLFGGRPEVSTSPLQVAVARLVGYRWPEQAEADDLGAFVDRDGIVCLPSVAGEAPAADRVQRVLAAALGDSWSAAMVKRLLEEAGSKKTNLADWLRDEFFKQHCALFGNRPFVWHIWDGQRDGFSALVNYHRLDRRMLEKLTFTYLGTDWVERQRAGVRDEVAGAEARLSAALELQGKLEAILEGDKPFDIYVRWKELHEQPIGWEPDLNDGVRLNIRPFVEAGVLRPFSPWPFKNTVWKKDRGTNPDGSERYNDIHLTLAEKRQARQKAGRT